jgi:hypothetical protein
LKLKLKKTNAKSLTKNPEAFTLKPSGDMEELPLDYAKVVNLVISTIFFLKITIVLTL